MYPLEIESVTKRYGHEVVVDDLTFTVAPGRVTGFLGPNGAGKSTTMKILLDLASADSGQATIAGTRYRDIKDPARTVGVVLEPNAFHPGSSGRKPVVPTFLTSPKRSRAVLAQLSAVLLGGALLALLGQALIIAEVALALPSTAYGFMVSAGDLTQLLAASTLAGGIGAVLGAGLGALIRNLGGAVTVVMLTLFVIPPLAVQLVSGAASWIPPTLFAVISGVSTEVGLWAALMAVAAWALVPAGAGLMAIQRRDVVWR